MIGLSSQQYLFGTRKCGKIRLLCLGFPRGSKLVNALKKQKKRIIEKSKE